jgi:hypothetical protein
MDSREQGRSGVVEAINVLLLASDATLYDGRLWIQSSSKEVRK